MPQIDLRDYLVAKSGTWVTKEKNLQAQRLTLSWNNDQLTLAGPLRLRISFFAENQTVDAQQNLRFHQHKLYSYVFEIPAGHQWSYTLHEDQQIAGRIGTNAGYDLVIELAGAEIATGVSAPGTDIPCDIAVANLPNLGEFFPSPCEPCPPGASFGVAPGATPALSVLPAAGGCVRPRFFNGMFITSEDMETLLRWNRLKMQMHNRASGQGVVWGLNLSRDGRDIRVHQGYAVDCCGNDLVLTTPYCVDIDKLLRDPAAAPQLAKPGPQKMHLLLEYHECPEVPRPIHGDPCSPQSNRCEVSRIRETVRLRLVPPREYQADGPIGGLLKEVEALKEDPAIAQILANSPFPVAADTTGSPAPELPAEVPYRIDVGLAVGAGDNISWISLQASTEGSVTQNISGLVGQDHDIRMRLTAANGQLLLADMIGGVDDADTAVARIAFPTQQIEWQVPFTDFDSEECQTFGNSPCTGTITVTDLRVGAMFAGPNTPQTISSPQITLTATLSYLRQNVGEHLSVIAHVAPVVLRAETPELASWPCFSDACKAGASPLFPVPLPWLHQDPFRSGEAAEPKVLLLAVVYAWLTSEIARHRVGTSQQTLTARLQAAFLIYRLLVAAFFGATSGVPLQRISTALQRLFCTWCQSLLYPGPRCTSEPHGVVIGCVRVEAGDISDIDIWDGRRHVIQYPLLAHWGEQIGLVPLDVMASRTLTMVCCMAGLPVPPEQVTVAPGVALQPIDITGAEPARAVPVGDAFLVVGEPSATGETGTPATANIVRRERLSSVAFINRVLMSLATAPSRSAARFVRYELAGARNLALLAPEPAAATTTPALQPERARLAKRVRSLADKEPADVPPLLEDLANELAAEVLRVTPLAIKEDNPLRERLINANLLSAGELLSFSPTDIHERIMERAEPGALTEVVRANDTTAADVTRVVTGAVAKFSSDKDIVALEELAEEENCNEFADALVAAVEARESLRIQEEPLRGVIASVIERRKSRR